jgi:microcompartment protein CcmK/EutM
MTLGRVVGHVVLSRAIEPLEGKILHLVQDVGRQLQGVGDPEVCVTWQAMKDDDLVIVEVAREACNAFDPPIPADAVVIGRADTIHIEPDATP